MTVADDLLDAAAALQHYMLHAIAPMPAFDGSANGHDKYDMGPLYDYWITQTIRMGREVQGALDRVKLVSRESVDGARHLSKFLTILQDRFEHTLAYRTPYSSTSNPHGMVRPPIQSIDASHKRKIWLLHRAIAMQILVLHLTRLQFLTLLVRADDMGSHSLLNEAFEEKMRHALDLLSRTMEDHGRDTLNSGQSGKILFVHDEYRPFLSELADAVDTLSKSDATEASCTTFTDDLFSGKGVALSLIREALGSDQVDLISYGNPVNPSLWNRVLGYNSMLNNAGDGYGPAQLAQFTNDKNFATNVNGPATAAEPGKLEEAIENSRQWGSITDVQPDQEKSNLLWLLTCGKLHDATNKLFLHAEANARGINSDDEANMATRHLPVLNFRNLPVAIRNDDLNQLQDSFDNIRNVCVFVMMRHMAYSTVHMACSRPHRLNPADQEANNAKLLRHTGDASMIPSGMYTETKRSTNGFLSRWNDDREFLNIRAAQPTVLSSLPYLNAQGADGVFVYNQRRVTQHRVVRLWRRKVNWTTNCEQLWGLTHCEATLMSDVYRLLGRLTVANREGAVRRVFPHNAVQDILSGILHRSIVTREMRRIADELVTNGSIMPQLMDGLTTTYEELLRVAEPSEQGNTTQPMPASIREWVQKIGEILETNFAGISGYVNAGNNIDISTFINRIRKLYRFGNFPIVANALALHTLNPPDGRTFPVVHLPLPDRFKNDNEIIFEPPNPNIYALLSTFGYNIDNSTIGLLLGNSCLFNSATIVHVFEACKALVRDWDRDQPALLPILNQPQLEFQVIQAARPLLPAYTDNAGQPTRITELLCPAEQQILHFISIRANEPNAQIQITLDAQAAHASRTEMHALADRLNREYSVRKPPFISPNMWLCSVSGTEITDFNWDLVEPNDRIDGVVFQLPVPPPPPAAAAAGAAAAPVPPPPQWYTDLLPIMRYTNETDVSP